MGMIEGATGRFVRGSVNTVGYGHQRAFRELCNACAALQYVAAVAGLGPPCMIDVLCVLRAVGRLPFVVRLQGRLVGRTGWTMAAEDATAARLGISSRSKLT